MDARILGPGCRYIRCMRCGLVIRCLLIFPKVISVVSVVSNAAVVAFTMDIFCKFSRAQFLNQFLMIFVAGKDVVWRWVYFSCFQYFVFVLMGYFSFIVDDVPEEVHFALMFI